MTNKLVESAAKETTKTKIELLEKGIGAITKDLTSGQSKIKAIFKAIWSYPIKILVSFVAAPFLIFKIAKIEPNPVRRWIAIGGLMTSLVIAYFASTLLGTLTATWMIGTNISIAIGFGFLFGTMISVYFGVIFAIIIFNAVSFFFLKASSQEVLDYLNSLTKE